MVLSLFFTRNISLETWVKKGLFDREKLIYEKHLNEGTFSAINWFTYGVKDKEISQKLIDENKLHKLINVYQIPRIFDNSFGRFIYVFLLPFIYFNIIKNSDILKTNQMDGSLSAILAKVLFQKPLIIRTGFTLSLFAQKMKKNKIVLLIVYIIEFLAYKSANKIIISSDFDKKYILKRYNIDDNKIQVLYNYINTEKFYNKGKNRIVDKLVTIVRLTEQKNLFNLIEAVSKTNYILDIYGDGELKKDLESFASELGAQVNFMGIVTNDEIIDILNSYQYFILASYYEGMPKVLLEAMSCGCICTGTDVMGINEVIKDRYNGYLSKSINSEDIKNMINDLKMNEDICINSLKTISTNFTLESFYNKEKSIYMECVNAR